MKLKTNYKKKQETFNQEKINFLDGIEFQNVDVWFPLLHGFNGEDGSIHGLLRFTKKPLVGCGIIGSALGMDKILILIFHWEMRLMSELMKQDLSLLRENFIYNFFLNDRGKEKMYWVNIWWAFQ